MDANTITIYRGHDTLRVVKGEHKPHAGSKAQRVTVYPNAQLAFASETDAAARAIIQRVEPSINADVVAKFVPAKRAKVSRKVAAEIQGAMGIGCTCPDDLLLESKFSDDCLVHGKHARTVSPLSPELEAEAQRYARSYGCTIEVARRDVMDEYENAAVQESEGRIYGDNDGR